MVVDDLAGDDLAEDDLEMDGLARNGPVLAASFCLVLEEMR